MDKESTINPQRGDAEVDTREQKRDLAYWLSQPVQVRIDALEQMRRERYGWEEGDEPRMRRDIVVKRKLED